MKNPISPQLMAPITAIVSEKYCKNLFPLSHHPFILLVWRDNKKIFATDLVCREYFYCNLIVCEVTLPPPNANASDASRVTSDLSFRENA